MQKNRDAFTMIELIFVIVIMGILAAIAIPKFGESKEQADIAKAKSDIAAIRSAIVNERQTRLIKGDPDWINSLSHETDTLFDGNGTGSNDVELLMYGITSGTSDGKWSTTSASFPYVKYRYKISGSNCDFTYSSSNGKFELDGSQPDICDKLVQ